MCFSIYRDFAGCVCKELMKKKAEEVEQLIEQYSEHITKPRKIGNGRRTYTKKLQRKQQQQQKAARRLALIHNVTFRMHDPSFSIIVETGAV